MTLEKSNKTENQTMRIIAIFYIAIGLSEVGYFAVEGFIAPPHILVLGILSLITAYSILKIKKWTMPLVIGLFLLGTTFGATTLANSIVLQTLSGAILFHVILIAYMIILFISSIYIIAKRKNFN